MADRTGLSLTLLMIGLQDFKSPQSPHLGGDRAATDRLLVGVADLLRAVFWSSDTLIRCGEGEFLVVMLGSKEQHSREAAERLVAKAEAWNRERARDGNEMVLIYSTAPYTQGADITSLLDRLRQQLMVQRKSLGLELASSLSQTGSVTPLIRLGVSFGDSVDSRWPEAEIQQVN